MQSASIHRLALHRTIAFPALSPNVSGFLRVGHKAALSTRPHNQQNIEGRMPYHLAPEAQARRRERWSDPEYRAEHTDRIVRGRHPGKVSTPSQQPALRRCEQVFDIGECVGCGATVVRSLRERGPIRCSTCREFRVLQLLADRRRIAA